MNETAVLSRFAANLRYDDLPAATVRHAREALLDWAGVAIAGADEPAARILRETALAGAGGSACWVAGAGYATDSAPLAALANGAASHALDFDDLHNPSVIHLGTVVIPAAVAAAQAVGASGRDLITALVAGFEVGGRVGESIIPESYYYWHTTGTAGVFGAAGTADGQIPPPRRASDRTRGRPLPARLYPPYRNLRRLARGVAYPVVCPAS